MYFGKIPESTSHGVWLLILYCLCFQHTHPFPEVLPGKPIPFWNCIFSFFNNNLLSCSLHKYKNASDLRCQSQEHSLVRRIWSANGWLNFWEKAIHQTYWNLLADPVQPIPFPTKKLVWKTPCSLIPAIYFLFNWIHILFYSLCILYLFMAKIRLQTRYTLLCYIIQFTASRFKCHIENSNLRSRDRCKKTSARKILCKTIIWRTDWKFPNILYTSITLLFIKSLPIHWFPVLFHDLTDCLLWSPHLVRMAAIPSQYYRIHFLRMLQKAWSFYHWNHRIPKMYWWLSEPHTTR